MKQVTYQFRKEGKDSVESQISKLTLQLSLEDDQEENVLISYGVIHLAANEAHIILGECGHSWHIYFHVYMDFDDSPRVIIVPLKGMDDTTFTRL